VDDYHARQHLASTKVCSSVHDRIRLLKPVYRQRFKQVDVAILPLLPKLGTDVYVLAHFHAEYEAGYGQSIAWILGLTTQ
jgi:hypothetical protein